MDLVTVVNVLLTAVSAGAAALGIRAWQRPVAWQKELDLASDVLVAAYGIERATKNALVLARRATRAIESGKVPDAERYRVATLLDSSDDDLRQQVVQAAAMIARVRALLGQLRAQELHDLVELFGAFGLHYTASKQLLIHATEEPLDDFGVWQEVAVPWDWQAAFDGDKLAVAAFMTSLQAKLRTVIAWAELIIVGETDRKQLRLMSSEQVVDPPKQLSDL